jgi:hypothetical protein
VSAFQVVLVAFLGLISLVGLAYMLVRAGSIGYFRTRDEYEREQARHRWDRMMSKPDEPAQKRLDGDPQ